MNHWKVLFLLMELILVMNPLAQPLNFFILQDWVLGGYLLLESFKVIGRGPIRFLPMMIKEISFMRVLEEFSNEKIYSLSTSCYFFSSLYYGSNCSWNSFL